MKTTTKKLVFAFSFMLVMITALFMMKAEAAGETYTLKGVSASGTGIDSSLKIANLSISRKWNAVPPSHTFEPVSTVLYKDVNLRKEYTGTAPLYGATYYVGIGVKNLVAGDHSIGISDDNTSVRNLTVPGYYTEYVRTITRPDSNHDYLYFVFELTRQFILTGVRAQAAGVGITGSWQTTNYYGLTGLDVYETSWRDGKKPPTPFFETGDSYIYTDPECTTYLNRTPELGKKYYVGIGISSKVNPNVILGISNAETAPRQLSLPGYSSRYYGTTRTISDDGWENFYFVFEIKKVVTLTGIQATGTGLIKRGANYYIDNPQHQTHFWDPSLSSGLYTAWESPVYTDPNLTNWLTTEPVMNQNYYVGFGVRVRDTINYVQISSNNTVMRSLHVVGFDSELYGTKTFTSGSYQFYYFVFKLRKQQPAEISGASLTLGERIDANIYVKVPNNAHRAVIGYSNPNSIVQDYNEYFFADMSKDSQGRYRLVLENIPSKELTETIFLDIRDEDDHVLPLLQMTNVGEVDKTSNGTDIYKFTAALYCNLLIDNPDVYAEKYRNIAMAMLNYGEAAQLQFRHKLDNLANPNAYLNSERSKVKANSKYNLVKPSNADALGYVGMSLNLEGATEIYLFFDHRVTAVDANGSAYKVEKNGAYYRVVIKDIYAAHLNKMHTVIIKENNKNYTFKVSALSYANMIINNGSNPNTLVNVAKSLYLLNKYAIAAFGQ